MFDFLDQLRQKPEEYRKAIALMSAGVIGGIIFIAWVASFIIKIPSVSDQFRNTGEEVVADVASVKEEVKFDINFSAVTDAINELKELLEEGINSVSNIGEPIEYDSAEVNKDLRQNEGLTEP